MMLKKRHIIITLLLAPFVLVFGGIVILVLFLFVLSAEEPAVCKHFSEPELKQAIANGFDINSGCCIEHMFFECSSPHTNASPLVYAVETNDLEYAKLLLAHGAQPNRSTDDGYPLTIAVQQGYEELFRLIMGQGPDADSVRAALTMAVHHGRPEMAEQLLARVPPDSKAKTCNEMACSLIEEFKQPGTDGHRKILAFIIETSCLDPNAACSTEHVLTSLATLSDNNLPFVKSLLERGADLNTPERNGKTVLQYIQSFSDYNARPRMKELLESR